MEGSIAGLSAQICARSGHAIDVLMLIASLTSVVTAACRVSRRAFVTVDILVGGEAAVLLIRALGTRWSKVDREVACFAELERCAGTSSSASSDCQRNVDIFGRPEAIAGIRNCIFSHFANFLISARLTCPSLLCGGFIECKCARVGASGALAPPLGEREDALVTFGAVEVWSGSISCVLIGSNVSLTASIPVVLTGPDLYSDLGVGDSGGGELGRCRVLRPGKLVREAAILAGSRVEEVGRAVVRGSDVVGAHLAIGALSAVYLQQLRELTKLAEFGPLCLRADAIACLHEVGNGVAAERAIHGPFTCATIYRGLRGWALLAGGALDAILCVRALSIPAWGAR